MIEPKHPKVSMVGQCRLLKYNRSSFYYEPRDLTQKNQAMMSEIDRQYLETPFYGSRRMQQHLLRLGYQVGRGKMGRLMKLMGLMAIYPKPRTTIPDKAHKKYPFDLLTRTDVVQGLTVAGSED